MLNNLNPSIAIVEVIGPEIPGGPVPCQPF